MARRRTWGDGSIYQRRADNRWVGSLVVGQRADGTPERRVVYGASRPEVRAKLDALLRQRANGDAIVATHLTVGEYLEQWCRESTASAEWRQSTTRTYEKMVRLYVAPRIGRVKLANLRSADLTSLYAALLQSGRVSKRRKPGDSAGLSAGQVRMVHRMLQCALRRAVRLEVLTRNVADIVQPPAAQRQEMRSLSGPDARRLLDAARTSGDRLEALWHLLVDSGLRIGEALALTWSHVSLERGTITITKIVSNTHASRPSFGEPKTARGRRMVTLTSPALEALNRHRWRQNKERKLAGEQWEEYDLVFSTRTGLALGQSWVRDLFKRALARAGLPESTRLHDLRHTNASLLLEAGVNPKVVADRLGHARVSITLDTYSHVAPSGEGQAAERLQALLYP